MKQIYPALRLLSFLIFFVGWNGIADAQCDRNREFFSVLTDL